MRSIKKRNEKEITFIGVLITAVVLIIAALIAGGFSLFINYNDPSVQIESALATDQAIARQETRTAGAIAASAMYTITPSATSPFQFTATVTSFEIETLTPDLETPKPRFTPSDDKSKKTLIILVKLEDRSSGNFHGDDPTTVMYGKFSDQVDIDHLPIEVKQLDQSPSPTELQNIGLANFPIMVLTGWYDSNLLTYHLDVFVIRALTGMIQKTDQFDGAIDFPGHGRYLSMFVLGLSQYFREDLKGAQKYTDEALSMIPTGQIKTNPADAYFLRGLIFHAIKEFTPTIGAYTQAIQFKPDVAEYYNSRGAAYDDIGDDDRAIPDYDKAIQLKPDSAMYYRNRGNAYLHIGNYGKAIDNYTQSIKLIPDDAETYLNRGDAYEYSGRYAQGIADYTQAIQLQPDYAVPYNERGIAHYDMEEFDQAIADYNKAIELDPNYADAYCNRGLAYTNQSKYDLAIDDLNIAIQLDPGNPVAYLNRGLAYKLKGATPKAIEDLKEVLILNPEPNVRQIAEDQLRALQGK